MVCQTQVIEEHKHLLVWVVRRGAVKVCLIDTKNRPADKPEAELGREGRKSDVAGNKCSQVLTGSLAAAKAATTLPFYYELRGVEGHAGNTEMRPCEHSAQSLEEQVPVPPSD